MENLFEAIILEAGFTAFWKNAPITQTRIFAWNGILATLYRRTFVEIAQRDAACQRAVRLLKEAA